MAGGERAVVAVDRDDDGVAFGELGLTVMGDLRERDERWIRLWVVGE